ncbi:glutathione peroxidase [Paenibacillus koleovorans]|uniref:glutathione peroxidase n=1 Tax=Paenibacillus koleovorans TaxID=121608 RepID=UPI000FD902D0|nr:glutathione peroxidase [Paenibacillus koleovorans]
MSSLFDVPVNDAKGQSGTLSAYKGEVLLIVNVASQCGLTPQYAGLEALYRKYKDRGFRILAFPSNDFAGQEPGTMEEIMEFCSLNYDVTFPLFEKVHAIGDERHPLYTWLTTHSDRPEEPVMWNFEKFLIDREGNISVRFGPKVTPEDESLVSATEKLL